LYVGDVSGDASDSATRFGAEPAEPSFNSPRPPPTIEDLLKEGQEIIVQAAKEPLVQKGARITCHVSLPSRLLVYLPGGWRTGVSRRIEDPAERVRLRSVVDGLTRDRGVTGAFIVRTAGMGETAEGLLSDLSYLVELWEEIGRRALARPAPALLHAE